MFRHQFEPVSWASRFCNGAETLGQVVKAVMETRSTHWAFRARRTSMQYREVPPYITVATPEPSSRGSRIEAWNQEIENTKNRAWNPQQLPPLTRQKETLRPYSDTPNQSGHLPIPPWPTKYSQAHLRPSFGDATRLAEEASSASLFSTVRPAQQTHTSEVIRIQKRCRETRHQDPNTSRKSRRLHLRQMRLAPRTETRRAATRRVLANRRRHIELLRKLQRGGEEVTFTTLSSAFELTGEAKDPFLIGGQIGHYFREYFRGKGEIDAFLIAALEPEHTSAFVYSQKAPGQPWHQWLASRHFSHEEATFITLSRKRSREAKDLLLIGSQIGLYFRKYFEEKGEINTFLWQHWDKSQPHEQPHSLPARGSRGIRGGHPDIAVNTQHSQ